MSSQSILLDHDNTISPSHIDFIAVYIDMARVLYLNLHLPTTTHEDRLQIVHNNIVADDRIIANFMRYPRCRYCSPRRCSHRACGCC